MTHLVHRSLRQDPPIAVRGEGIYLYDRDGHQVIDGSGGAAVACLGHGNARVIAAIKAQLDQLSYAHTALFSCESAERSSSAKAMDALLTSLEVPVACE